MINFVLKKINRDFKKLIDNSVEKEVRKLANLPRYTKGEIKWAGKSFKFIDANSFVWTYNEIFKKHIYRFNSEIDSPIIIDCGANIGLSVIYFKHLYPKAKVIAFEPDVQVFDYLRYNTDSFELKDVKLINKGLWNEEKELVFFSEGADAGRISNYRESIVESPTHKINSILTTKLSQHIQEFIDFLKIDIEGAETNVLIEIQDKLHLVKNIFIEYHSFFDTPQTLNKILDILSINGFRYYIDSPVSLSSQPFIDRGSFLSMDLLINIYAYRMF